MIQKLLKPTLLLLAILLFGSASAFAQKSTIIGTLLDKADDQPLIGAAAVIKGKQKGAVSNTNGVFSIPDVERNKTILIEISYIGYKPRTIEVKPTKKTYKIPTPIYLEEESELLDEVLVTAASPIGKVKGDTVQFTSSAYKTNPDATASDLLKKMPGFEVEDNGKVSAMGESVSRVYVDGKSFFKNDVSTALNALDADMIESVELFDDKSDRSKFTGQDDGTEIKTINIVTKNRLGEKPAYLLEATGGYGYDNVYQGNVTYTQIKGDRKISIMGGMNNININPVQQRRGFGMGRDMGGLSTKSGLAVNYTDKLKNDGEISVYYSFDRDDTDKLSDVLRTYFPSERYEDYTFHSFDTTSNVSTNHRISLDLKSNLSDKTQLTFRPYVRLSFADNGANTYNESIIDGVTTLNSRSNTSNLSSYDISGELNLLQKVTDKNYLSFSVEGDLSNSDTETLTKGETIFDTEKPEEMDIQDQETYIINKDNEVRAEAEYVQNLSKTSNLSMEYELGYNWSENNRETYVYDQTTGMLSTEIDPLLSNHFQRDYLTNTLRARYNFNTKKNRLSLNAGYRTANLQNDQLYPVIPDEDNRDYRFNSPTFGARYSYQGSKGGSMVRLSYNGNARYPSIGNLQNVMNTDNPLHLSSGNPDLDQSFNHSLYGFYRGASMEKGMFWTAFGRVAFTQNAIVNSTTLLDKDTTVVVAGSEYLVKKGAQYSKPVNLDGNFSGNVGLMYSFPIMALKSKANVMAMYMFSKKSSLFNDEKFATYDNTVRFTVGLHSNISQNIDFSIRNSAMFNFTNSERTSTSRYFSNDLNTNIYWNIWNNFFATANYTMRYQKMENTPLDDPYTNLLNVSIGKKFGKGGKYEVRASVYDALNENRSIMQSASDIFVSETLANNLTRYVALTFTYKFNSLRNNKPSYGRGPGGPMGGRGPGGPGRPPRR